MASLKSSKSWSRSWLRKVLSGSWLSTCSPERQELRNGHILFSKYILNYDTSGYFLVKKISAWLNSDKFRFVPPAAWPCRQVGRRDHSVRGAVGSFHAWLHVQEFVWVVGVLVISMSPSTSTSTCFTTTCFANFPFFPRSIFLTLPFRVLILWFGAARPTHSITNTMSVQSDHSRYCMVKACQETTSISQYFGYTCWMNVPVSLNTAF